MEDLKLKNSLDTIYLTFSAKDKSNQIEIAFFQDDSVWINREEAVEIIEHLRKQYDLK